MGLECRDFAGCITGAAISDYIYNVPEIIGDGFGMPNEQYRTLAIALPVIASSTCYLIFLGRSWGESRRYGLIADPLCSDCTSRDETNERGPIFTKWSFAKIFGYTGVITVVPFQLYSSIVNSAFHYPQSELDTFVNFVKYEATYEFGNSSACVGLVQQAIDVYSYLPDFVNAVDQNLQKIPHYLGGTTLFVTLMIGVKVLISCCERKKFDRGDAFQVMIVVGMIFFSIYQLAIGSRLSFNKYLEPDLTACRYQYMN